MKDKLLIIDDDLVLSKTTSRRLVKRGYDVTVVNSGKEGLKLIGAENFSLILLDIIMPEMSGTDVLEVVRKSLQKNSLPIIMISSLEEQGDIVHALRVGANDYITKPINMDVLTARIETQLEVKKLSQEFATMKELEAVTAMVATYNHEINNPLAIAFGLLEQARRKGHLPNEVHKKINTSLIRIRNIVKKIDRVAEETKLDFEDYTKKSKMIKLL